MFVVVVKVMTTVRRIFVFSVFTWKKCDIHPWFEMILNYRVIVDMYPILKEVVGNLIPVVKPSLYLT